MTTLIPLNINIHERTLTSSYGAFVVDLAPRLDSYEHSISATFGFETLRISFAATVTEALEYTRWLGYGVQVWDGRINPVWQGYLSQVEFSVGSRNRSIALDAMANRVRARYTTVLGTPAVTATSSSAGSQAIYGVKDRVLNLGATVAAAAQAVRDQVLNDVAYPKAQPVTEIATGSSGESVTVTMTFAGWYATLDWIVFERTDTSTEVTTTQVGALIGTVSPGIGATNAFLSTSTTQIEASGVSDTRRVEADTTYRQAIEDRLARGTSAGQRFAWGVYEDRVLRVATWAGATPSTIDYYLRLGSVYVRDSNGLIVDPWLVRPDAMIEETDLIEVGPVSTASDTASRFYAERVVFSADRSGYRLSIEPAATTQIDAVIARLGG